jgi:hypothetical protein
MQSPLTANVGALARTSEEALAKALLHSFRSNSLDALQASRVAKKNDFPAAAALVESAQPNICATNKTTARRRQPRAQTRSRAICDKGLYDGTDKRLDKPLKQLFP